MRRSLSRAWLVGLLVLVAATAGAQSDERLLELTLGQSSTLSLEGIASYSASGPGIVETTPLPDGTGLVVLAIAPGETALLLIGSDGTQISYRIRVTGSRGPRRIPSPGDLTIAVGAQRVIEAASVASYSVTPMGIVDVTVHADRGELEITGRRAGVASIVLVFADRHTETRRVEVTEASAPTPERVPGAAPERRP